MRFLNSNPENAPPPVSQDHNFLAISDLVKQTCAPVEGKTEVSETRDVRSERDAKEKKQHMPEKKSS